MGMVSYFENEDIEVVDWSGLKQFFKDYEKIYPYSEIQGIQTAKDMIKIDKDEKEYLTFEAWNDLKLISYWYPHQILFLECIAKFIRGEVSWEFENNDESGNIKFEDGKCKLNLGQMGWNEYSPLDLRGLKEYTKEQKKLLTLYSL